MRDSEFLADSAATAHICHNAALLHDFTPSDGSQTVMTGAGPLPIAGYGTCLVKDAHSNQTFTLHNVMYVPSCPVNIYSTTQLNREGGTFTTTSTQAKLTDRHGRTLTSRMHYRHIYLLNGVYPSHSAFATSHNDLETWHRRLGHVGYESLHRMRTLHCVDGLIVEADPSPPPECTACVTGKFKRSPFPTDTKTYRPLQLVHSDICGDFPVALNGHRWFTTVRDKATGYTLVHTHAHKHEAAHFVQTSILKLERKTGLKVQCLRTDRGSEYMSNEMQLWLKSKGIEHQPTPIESSATNGVAERVNLTLMDRVRATLADTNQPRLLWPWALQHVAHALNFIPSATQSKTPHELLFGTPPDVSHLHAFGAAVAAWKPLQKRADKLEPRADLGRFVGYTSSSKIYQVCSRHSSIRASRGERVVSVIYERHTSACYALRLSHPRGELIVPCEAGALGCADGHTQCVGRHT